MRGSAVLYARVSTADQRADGQVDALALRARADGYESWTIYREQASGVARGRPALERMMRELPDAISPISPTTVYCFAFDRLGRSLVDLLQLVDQITHRAHLVCLRDPVDTRSPAGRLVLQVMGAMAEFERARTRERVLAGISAVRARGGLLGRPRRVIEIDRILDAVKSAETIADAARALKIPRTTLIDHVRRHHRHKMAEGANLE